MSGIETAARVAALREKAARARFGSAGAALRAAEEHSADQVARLSATAQPTGGDAGDLRDWHSTTLLRADAARTAEAAVTEAADARQAALLDWQDLSRRREALDEVVRRWRAAQRVKADKDAQRLMDDLAKRRKEWS